MTHLKNKRSMLAATALLCGLSPATSAMGQTYPYPAGRGNPSTLGVFGGTTNIQGGPSFASANALGCAPGLVRYVARPPLPPTVYCVRPAAAPSPPPRPAAAPSPPPRPPQARDVGYGVPYTNGPCASTTSGAVMSPCRGSTGSQIQVRLQRSLGATPAILSFRAVVSRYVGSRLQSRLIGSGLNYSTVAPPQLCIAGGGTWVAELVLANGQNLGVLGSYTPTNCPA